MVPGRLWRRVPFEPVEALPAEPLPAQGQLRSSWRKVGGPLLILRVAGQGTEFVGFVLLARRLGTASFGRLAVAFLICRYAGLVADWGASVRGARDVVIGDDGAARPLVRLRSQLTVLSVAGYACVVLAIGEAEFLPLAAAIAGRGLNRDWLALGRDKGVRAGLPALVQGVALVATAAMAHTEGQGALAIGAAYGLAAALSISLNRLSPRALEGKVSLNGWMLGAVMADQVTASTDTVLLAALSSTAVAGIYAAVYRIPNAFVTVIGLVVVGLVPITTRALMDGGLLARHRRVALRTGVLAGFGVAATIPLAWVLVPVVFGDAYRPGQVPLAILLMATAVGAAAAPLHPLYLALGRDRWLAITSASAATLNLVGNVLVIPEFGMRGAATTTLAAQVLLLGALWFGMRAPQMRTGDGSS